jgi:predicted nucleotidyltransferase
MLDIKEILEVAKIHPYRAISAYVYGSRIYGTSDENSDWDISVIAKTSVEAIELKTDQFNIHVYTWDRWVADLEWHNPKNLECHLAPERAILLEKQRHNLTINEARLRHAVCHVSSNSWVKARKKLEGGEYRTGVKSLFHSIRIPMFGSQIAQTGVIGDFSCANEIWKEIDSKQWDWTSLDERFRKDKNSVLTEFRKYAAK